MLLLLLLFHFILKTILFIDLREGRERGKREGGKRKEKTPSICCPTYLHIHWLILGCALTRNKPAASVHQAMLSPVSERPTPDTRGVAPWRRKQRVRRRVGAGITSRTCAPVCFHTDEGTVTRSLLAPTKGLSVNGVWMV